MRLRQLAPLLFIACALGFASGSLDPEPAPAPPAPGVVQVWVTTGDATKLLERQADLAWSTSLAARTDNAVVDETQRFQPIEGFGASMRMPALWTEADPAVRDEIMRRLFSRSSGIGLSLLRVPMGETGLVGPDRTYNDLPSGQTDPTLSKFSINGDLEWKIPMVQRAKELNPEVTVLGTPWSAPAWIKTSGNLGYGKLKPEYYGVYANYFVRWLQEWNARGLGVSLLSMQNEPQHEPYWYQGMRMDVADQIDFAKALGPALDQAGFSARILAWDHNCDNLAYPIAVLNDPVARNWIHGAAFHAYAGTTSDIYQFVDAHPDKAVYFTEQTGLLPNRGFGGSLMWHARNIFLVPSLNNARTNAVWMLDRRLDRRPPLRPHFPRRQGLRALRRILRDRPLLQIHPPRRRPHRHQQPPRPDHPRLHRQHPLRRLPKPRRLQCPRRRQRQRRQPHHHRRGRRPPRRIHHSRPVPRHLRLARRHRRLRPRRHLLRQRRPHRHQRTPRRSLRRLHLARPPHRGHRHRPRYRPPDHAGFHLPA
ncbi:MAG: hypothetical protein MUE42_06110 [Opitutaceae bacterium]|nr:hypothetical protein [Opitutaceae bacterium]